MTGSGSSRTYSWSSANPTTNAGPFTVTATNGAGLVSSGSNVTDPFTLTGDSTAPTGGSIKANGSSANSYNTTGTVALAVTNFADSGSGIATNAITRSSGTLTNNTCGAVSGATPVTLSGGNDSDTLSTGCYQYTLTGTDNVGNVATATSAIVMVDTSPPVLTIMASGPNVYYPGSGSIVYFSGTGTTSSFTITASDSSTGISSTTFPAAPAGWTKSTGTNTATYTRTSATASSSLAGVSATNNAGSTTSETVTISLDKTGPVNNLSLSNQTGGWSALSNVTVYYQGSVAGSLTVTNAVSDPAVGPASSTFAALAGTSTGFTFAQGTVSAPAGGPYVSGTFSWAAGTTSSPTETITGSDNVGNSVATTITFVDDTNTLTQNAPFQFGANTFFWGTASSTANPVTVYYCLGTVTSCTASTATGSVTANPGGGGFWFVGAGLISGQAYSSEAYQTDSDGVALSSNIEQFTG